MPASSLRTATLRSHSGLSHLAARDDCIIVYMHSCTCDGCDKKHPKCLNYSATKHDLHTCTSAMAAIKHEILQSHRPTLSNYLTTKYDLIPLIQACLHALQKEIDAHSPLYALAPFLPLEYLENCALGTPVTTQTRRHRLEIASSSQQWSRLIATRVHPSNWLVSALQWELGLTAW